jgi:hypothetical protein
LSFAGDLAGDHEPQSKENPYVIQAAAYAATSISRNHHGFVDDTRLAQSQKRRWPGQARP